MEPLLTSLRPVEIFKGMILFWALFYLYVLIAFGIFTREDDTNHIFVVWILAVLILGWFLYRFKWLSFQVGAGFILMLIFVVFMYFAPVQNNIPEEAIAFNTAISEQHEDRMEYARELFYELHPRWETPIRQYLLEIHGVLFVKDFKYFWEREGEYVDSNIQAQIYRLLLIESNRFREEEVELSRKGCVNSPHTVVVIHTEEREVYADLWAADHFDEYEFGMYTDVPCDEVLGEGY